MDNRPNQGSINPIVGVTIVFLLALVCGQSARAQIMDYNRWKIDVTPYFWLSGSNGDIVVDAGSWNETERGRITVVVLDPRRRARCCGL